MSNFVLSAFADEIDMDLKTQMDILEKHDIHYIEMRGVNGKGIVDYSLEEVKGIKKLLDERGFKISSVGSPIGKILITDDFKPHLELFEHTLNIAKILESKYIRMFSFFIPKDEAPEKYRDEVISRWREFVRVAKDYNIILLHENEKDIYGDTAQRCLDIMQSINSEYVKAVFDPANFVQCNVKPYPQAYTLLKDYVVYVHVKDAVYSDHHVVPAGEGDGKVKELLTYLHKNNYNGFLSLEPHLGVFSGLKNLELDNKNKQAAQSGPELFNTATKALKGILCEITKGGQIL
ncbi:MAG: sugar phosphate isomerase/epimerase family protein [Clostridium sp.]|uniref:sugar phosphate isomerase/epimerase family protein n=1 Tax=Clostridium sp. TaxID=1506 RepID=UPI003D6CAE36